MSLDDVNVHAARVINTLEEFISTLIQRVDTNRFRKVIYDNEPLRPDYLGDRHGQEPTQFVAEELIDKLAEALEYEYRRQPTGFAGLAGDSPDFTILNTESTVIGEVRAPNTIDSPRDEPADSLDRADARPLTGITTDGTTWILHTADEDGEPEYRKHISIDSILTDMARMRDSERSPQRSRAELRESCEEFIDTFHVKYL